MKPRAPLIFAVLLGAAILGFLGYAFSRLGRDAAAGNRVVEGTIVRREFTPGPEEQVTFGRGGLSARQTRGEHVFVVRAPNGREYRVPVEEAAYDSKREGDRFLFLRR